MKQLTVNEILALPQREFIDRCKKWMNEFNGGNYMDIDNPNDCPLAIWVAVNDKKCSREMVPNTASCPLCGHPVCPDCMNHCVEQLSRVTGYLSTVSGWNEAKKQEFEDRNRYDV